MEILIFIGILIVIIIIATLFPVCGPMPDMEDDKYKYHSAGPEHYWRYNKKTGKWKMKP